MTSTPTQNPPRQSVVLSPSQVEASERELVELLQKALAPSFVLVRRLGAGGMGIVFLARDPALKRLVAVKVMSPERAYDPDARARFQREAEAVAAISHPNVVAVHSVGALPNGLPYLVMQYVDGPSMAERLAAEGPLDLESAKKIMGQVASALEAAHRKGIIHRDIKAANILWDDASGRALVSDFGIAGILAPDYDTEILRLTQTGAAMGTPRYMSPEQLLNEPVTDKTDVYSLGLLGYELLTGEGPYQMTSPNAIVAAHLRDTPRPLSTMRPDADPVLESLLAACLEKDAHGRPTAEDVAKRLQHGASILLEWPPPGLEDLHGAIARPLGRMLGGAFAIAVPLTIVATAPAGSALRPGWPQVLILPSIAAVGGLAVFLAVVEGAKLLRGAMHAARAGYGWGIIAEVLADVKKDGGAIIAGDRDYAALTVGQRNTIRRNRVLRAGLQLSASVWALAGFFIGLPITARSGTSPSLLALWSLGIPLALLIGAEVVGRFEKKTMEPIRERVRKHRAPMERLTHLAETWRDSFDRLITESGVGQGVIGKVARRTVAIAGVTSMSAMAAIAGYGLITYSVMATALEKELVPRISSVAAKARRVERLKVLRPPIDPSITSLRAGYALQSLATAGSPAHSSREAPTKYPIGAIPEYEGLKLFGTTRGQNAGAIRHAAAGLTPEHRAHLERIASAPGGEELRILAHAERIDWAGAALVDPLPPNVSLWSIPLPKYSRIKNRVSGQRAAAALAFADGKPAEAERLLKELIGVGFAMEESPMLIENLIGVNFIEAARAELVSLYELTGRAAEARAIAVATDPVIDVSASTETDPGRMSLEARDAYVRELTRDSSQLEGMRWELGASYHAYRPCVDMRQVLFGPDAEHNAALAEARRLLVRTKGGDKVMGTIEHALDREVTEWPKRIAARSLFGFAKTVDALSGSRRMQSCSFVLGPGEY